VLRDWSPFSCEYLYSTLKLIKSKWLSVLIDIHLTHLVPTTLMKYNILFSKPEHC
jgi:hypothetical protein